MKNYIFLIVPLFLLISCGQVERTPEQATQESSSLSENSGENPFDSISGEYLQNENFLQCSREAVDQCIMTSLSQEESLNLETCDDLVMETNQNSCKQSVLTAQARESGDMSICDSLADPEPCKSEILVAKGIETKDDSLCDDLSGQLKLQCTNTVVRSISYDTLDDTWCDKLVVEVEGDAKETLIENCKNDVKVSKEIQDEIAEEQAAVLEQEKKIAEEVQGVENIEESTLGEASTTDATQVEEEVLVE